MINLQSIINYVGANLIQRNFDEGERELRAKHIILCGKLSLKPLTIKDLCLQTSCIRERPHEITGIIAADGKITNFKCFCKSGAASKCKHIVAVLLHCYS